MRISTIHRFFLSSVLLTLFNSASVLAQSGNPGPSLVLDSVGNFQPPGEYPLVHEGSVQVRRVIRPSAFKTKPESIKHAFPVRFDLRNVDGHNYVTPVKNQSGGTCWTHGTMASLESNVLMSGLSWIAYLPSQGYPCMDEYHLDWWNGFNQHYNADILPLSGQGLAVHNGGDYLVAAAYFARGDGAIDRYLTTGVLYAGSYTYPATYRDSTYDYYFPREIEWLTAGPELEKIDVIKGVLQTDGAVATAICWTSGFYNATRNSFYQPASNDLLPNHSVTIVGWDDTLTTQAPERGAWLCKNSWGTSWGQGGYFWISYLDKTAGKDLEMGAVVFRDIEITGPRTVYYHDYHGWRDTREGCQKAINAFTALDDRMVSEASFISAADNVAYTLEIFDDFDVTTGPVNLLASAQGTVGHVGLYTVTLDRQLRFRRPDDFFITLQLSEGGMPFDRTSQVPVLLGTEFDDVIVRSTAAPGESYYWDDNTWHDMYGVDSTANFCMKALADRLSPVRVSRTIGKAPLDVTFSAVWPEAEILEYQWGFDDGTSSSEATPVCSFEQPGFHNVSLDLTTSKGIVRFFHKSVLGVQADTMVITSDTVHGPGVAKVDVLAHNFLPLSTVVVPFTWEGPLDISFDSVSTAGCRTEGVGYVDLIDLDQSSRGGTIFWQGDQSACLDQGNGPILSLYFTVRDGVGGEADAVRIEEFNACQPRLICAGLAGYQPEVVDGQISFSCCAGRVGNANGIGDDEPTIGDICTVVYAKFVAGSCAGVIDCLAEADVNQSGGSDPACADITIGDVQMLIDYLFVNGRLPDLPDCL